jgi:hypothetical protein
MECQIPQRDSKSYSVAPTIFEYNNAEHQAIAVKDRPTAISGIYRCVNLNKAVRNNLADNACG